MMNKRLMIAAMLCLTAVTSRAARKIFLAGEEYFLRDTAK